MTEQPGTDEFGQHLEINASSEHYHLPMQPGEIRDILPPESGRQEQTLFRLADTSSKEARGISDVFSLHTDQEGRWLLETNNGTPEDAFVVPKGVDVIVGDDGIWTQPSDKSQPPQMVDTGDLPLAARRLLMQARYGAQQNPGSIRKISLGLRDSGDGRPFLSVRNVGNVPLELENHLVVDQEGVVSDSEQRSEKVQASEGDRADETNGSQGVMVDRGPADDRSRVETPLIDTAPQNNMVIPEQGKDLGEQSPSESQSELPPEIVDQYIREMAEDRDKRLRSFEAFEQEIDDFNITDKHINEAVGILKAKIDQNRLMDRPRELFDDIENLQQAIRRQYDALDQLTADFRRRVADMLDEQQLNRGRNEAERQSRNALLNHYAVGGKGATELRQKLNDMDDIISYEMISPLRRLDMAQDAARFARDMEDSVKRQAFIDDLSRCLANFTNAMEGRDKVRGKFMELYNEMKGELEKV